MKLKSLLIAFCALLAFLISCSSKTIKYRITGQTQNTKYTKYAYLYIEKDSSMQADFNLMPNVLAFRNIKESDRHIELLQCKLANNSFSFKGKIAKSIKNPFTVAYLFMDSVAAFSKEEAMSRIRSDRKMIILDDRLIKISIKHNLLVASGHFQKGEINNAYDEVSSVSLKCYTDEVCRNFANAIKKHHQSIASLYFLNEQNSFRVMPLEYLEEGAFSLSPKIKKTDSYKELVKQISERRERYRALNLK